MQELHLQFDDLMNAVPTAVEDGAICPAAAALLNALNNYFGTMGAEKFWPSEGILGDSAWQGVRELAAGALEAIQAVSPPKQSGS